MQKTISRKAPLAHAALLAVLACGAAHASERRFEPVPQSSQRVQTLSNATIITGEGARVSAGASMGPGSARQVGLSLSLKNTGPAALDFPDSAIKVTSGGKSLEMQRLDEGANDGKSDGYMRDDCANATASSQLNCGIDSFTKRQHHRVAAASENQVAPGQLATRQFQITLPKRDKQAPTALNISIEVGGELIAFDFKEAN
jgi:hypothetical protein